VKLSASRGAAFERRDAALETVRMRAVPDPERQEAEQRSLRRSRGQFAVEPQAVPQFHRNRLPVVDRKNGEADE
jgi:hypothetical protein